MRNIHVTPEPVTLEGFQAVLKPSKFGYSLKAVVGEDLISKLETERDDCLKWAESKLKNQSRTLIHRYIQAVKLNLDLLRSHIY